MNRSMRPPTCNYNGHPEGCAHDVSIAISRVWHYNARDIEHTTQWHVTYLTYTIQIIYITNDLQLTNVGFGLCMQYAIVYCVQLYGLCIELYMYNILACQLHETFRTVALGIISELRRPEGRSFLCWRTSTMPGVCLCPRGPIESSTRNKVLLVNYVTCSS